MKSKGKLSAARTQKDVDLEFMDDKNHPNDLVLKVQGKRIVVTPEDLRKLFYPGHAKDFDLKSNKTAKPEAQRGGNNVKDMIDFFKSPAGDKVKNLKKMQCAALLDLLKDQEKESKRHALKKALYMANLRLLRIAKREEQAKRYTESWANAIEKTLAQGRVLIEQNSYANTAGKANKDADHAQLRAQIAQSYQLATDMCEADVAEKEAKLKEIDALIIVLDQELSSINTRYNLLDESLQALDEDAERFESMESPQESIQAIEAALAVSHSERAQIISTFHQLNAQGQFSNALLYRLDAVDTRIQALSEMRSLARSEKHGYDRKGAPVHSYRDAAFIIEGKLHQDVATGQLYLLRPGQNFQNLTDKDRAEAKNRYENDKQELTSVKEVIKENKKTEMSRHYLQENEAVARQTEAKNELQKSKETLQQVNMAKVSAMTVKNPTQADLVLPTQLATKPAPAPKPAPAAPVEKVQQTGSYSTIMDFMRDVEAMKMKVTSELLSKARDRLPNQNAQKTLDLIIRPGEPIPPLKMQRIQEAMGKFYAIKQNASEQAKSQPEQTSGYKSPTPLNTKT